MRAPVGEHEREACDCGFTAALRRIEEAAQGERSATPAYEREKARIIELEKAGSQYMHRIEELEAERDEVRAALELELGRAEAVAKAIGCEGVYLVPAVVNRIRAALRGEE